MVSRTVCKSSSVAYTYLVSLAQCTFPPGGPITLLPFSGNCCNYREYHCHNARLRLARSLLLLQGAHTAHVEKAPSWSVSMKENSASQVFLSLRPLPGGVLLGGNALKASRLTFVLEMRTCAQYLLGLNIGLDSCAIEFTSGRQFYECLDTQSDLESCEAWEFDAWRAGTDLVIHKAEAA
jgi:hypothetical protein